MRQTFLPYCKPFVDNDEMAAVIEALSNGWLTTGPKVKAFEQAFAEEAGVRHAIALNSCTAGLHLALVALGVGPGDEVITPSLTFVAGAQCIRELGARPVFCDIDETTLCLSVRTIDAVVTERTKAIIAMPYAGRPTGIAAIVAYAHARGIAVIEDAAHGVGMLDDGAWPGAVADIAVYSFYATKNVTSGEGGMLVTADDALADRIRILSLHGMDRDAWKRYTRGASWKYDVVEPGYKYNMPDLLAAVGLENFKKLNRMQARRRELAARYIDGLSAFPGVRVPGIPLGRRDRHAWCMFALLIDEAEAGASRDELIDALREAQIGTSVHYIPTHHFSAYRDLPRGPLPVTEKAARQLVSLPLYPSMTDRDAEDVLEAIGDALSAGRYVRMDAAPRRQHA